MEMVFCQSNGTYTQACVSVDGCSVVLHVSMMKSINWAFHFDHDKQTRQKAFQNWLYGMDYCGKICEQHHIVKQNTAFWVVSVSTKFSQTIHVFRS